MHNAMKSALLSKYSQGQADSKEKKSEVPRSAGIVLEVILVEIKRKKTDSAVPDCGRFHGLWNVRYM
jgi:hypothetical protein